MSMRSVASSSRVDATRRSRLSDSMDGEPPDVRKEEKSSAASLPSSEVATAASSSASSSSLPTPVAVAGSSSPSHLPPEATDAFHEASSSSVEDPSEGSAKDLVPFFLDKESDDGNIEYKRQLLHPSAERFQQLVSQMKFRMHEGQGEAIYELGVDDNGYPKGLNEAEMEESLATLRRMADELHAAASVVAVREVEGGGKVAEVLIRTLNEDNFVELRLAVCGNVDAGKSTLVGVLTRGQLDNGRGTARLSVFTHKHEVESGRTSDISHQIVGFSAKGEWVNGSPSLVGGHSMTMTEHSDVLSRSSKIVTLLDLAGHEKYLKTTCSGLSGQIPDYGLVVVGANMGISKMTREHIGLLLSFRIPLVFVVTKIDICPSDVLSTTVEEIKKILKLPGVRKMAHEVHTEDDVVLCAKNLVSDRCVPIFQLSSVTGTGLKLLLDFINLLPPRTDWESARDLPAEALIDGVFKITGVGTVVSALVTQGMFSQNDSVLLGPDKSGRFETVSIRSIHSKRTPVHRVFAGTEAGLALRKVERNAVRKGMVLLAAPSPLAAACLDFEADVVVLHCLSSTTIHDNYQCVMHVRSVRQTAKVVGLGRTLHVGDSARVHFHFLFRPEFVRIGWRVLFRNGKTKGVGTICEVHPMSEEDESCVVGRDRSQSM